MMGYITVTQKMVNNYIDSLFNAVEIYKEKGELTEEEQLDYIYFGEDIGVDCLVSHKNFENVLNGEGIILRKGLEGLLANALLKHGWVRTGGTIYNY